MPCELCQKREAEERRALADCKQQTEQLSLKAQRLSLSVAVLGTLAGREAVDYALGISNNITQLSVVDQYEGGSVPKVGTSDVVVEVLDSVVVGEPVSELENLDYFGGGVDGYEWALPPLLPIPYESVIQPVKYQGSVVGDLFASHANPLLFEEEYLAVPSLSSSSVLVGVYLMGSGSRKRR